MSSMRNAVQRRNHKERAQPLERQKWGLLEKHKDYSKRAADHNVKKRKIKALQAKATERNEDEFYFGMLRSQTDGGVRRTERGAENGGSARLSRETIDLMKTQDVGYLRSVVQSTRRERERLENEVVLAEKGVDLGVDRKKRLTFDDKGELILPDRASISHDEELGGNDISESGSGDEGQVKLNSEERKARHKLGVKRRKVEALKEREQQLSTALRGVEDQRARMKGSIGGVNKKGVAFKIRSRKR